MRFMMMVKATQDSEACIPPSPALVARMQTLMEEGMKSGVVLETGGLLPSSTGARVRSAGGKLIVTDGPFAETTELIGGYAIVQAETREEAIELGRQFMQAHVEVLGPSYEGEVEIRPMFPPGACGSGRETGI
jgi:hypothetical protein